MRPMTSIQTPAANADLATEPVFHLNVLLWALEDLPDITAVQPALGC